MMHRTALLLCGALVLSLSAPALAGVLLSPGVHWKSFSFDPKVSEPTPNYSGYGGSLYFGYSFAQALDLALFGTYTPAHTTNNEDTMDPEALHRFVGAAIGVRYAHSVVATARVGRLDYHLLKHVDPDEVSGHYSGIGSGASLGGIIPVTKSNFWQVTLDVDIGAKLTPVGPGYGDEESRKISAASLSLAYVFNHFYNSNSDASALGAFFHSL